MPVVSLINQKGGCGKTLTAVNLSAALAANRKTTLLIDMDPQGHAALALGIDAEEEPTMFEVLDLDTDRPLGDVVRKLSPTLHLAPSNIYLSILEQKLAGVTGRENRLQDKVADLHSHYDYVIIDCPPNLGLLTLNALICSGRLIVPVDASTFSLHGIENLRKVVAMLHSTLDHNPCVYGVATILDKRTRFARAFLDKLQEIFGENLYATTIPSSITFREAAEAGLPIIDYAPYSKGAEAALNLAGEILRKDKHSVVKSFPTTVKLKRQVKDTVFTFPNDSCARVVQVAGEFNNWNPAKSVLKKRGDGSWEGKFSLKPGHYQYKYVVDGEWTLDPRNERTIEASAGVLNSLITVKQE